MPMTFFNSGRQGHVKREEAAKMEATKDHLLSQHCSFSGFALLCTGRRLAHYFLHPRKTMVLHQNTIKPGGPLQINQLSKSIKIYTALNIVHYHSWVSLNKNQSGSGALCSTADALHSCCIWIAFQSTQTSSLGATVNRLQDSNKLGYDTTTFPFLRWRILIFHS